MSQVIGPLPSVLHKDPGDLEEALGPFKDIPEELIFYIFSHFESSDLCQIPLLNKSWKILFKKNETTCIHTLIESICDQIKPHYPDLVDGLQRINKKKKPSLYKYKNLIRILKQLDFRNICLLRLEDLPKPFGFTHFHQRVILSKLLELNKKRSFCFFTPSQDGDTTVLMIGTALILKKIVENKDFKKLPTLLREMVQFFEDPNSFSPQHEFLTLFEGFIGDNKIISPLCKNEEEKVFHLDSNTNDHLINGISLISTDFQGDILITLIHLKFYQSALNFLNGITYKEYKNRFKILNTNYENDYLVNKIIESAIHLAEVNEINTLTTFLCHINNEKVLFETILKAANKLIELNKTKDAFDLLFTIYILEKDYDDFEIIKNVLAFLKPLDQPFRLTQESPFPHLTEKWEEYKKLLEETL